MGEYKLRMNDAVGQLQEGLANILYNKSFLDVVISCSDGILHHSRLTVSFIFPELVKSDVFNFPIQQNLLLPHHTVAEVQALVEELFSTADTKFPVTNINENDIELVNDPRDDFAMETDSIYSDSDEIYGKNSINYYELDDADFKSYNSSKKSRGGRRGRPPLCNRSMPERFRCNVCDKGFYYNSMLTQHMKTHTGGIPRETCPQCGVEYATRQILKAHMIRHHGPDSYISRPRGRPPGKRKSTKLEGNEKENQTEKSSSDSVEPLCGEGLEDRVEVKEELDSRVGENSNNPLDSSNDGKATDDDLSDNGSDQDDRITMLMNSTTENLA